MVVSDVSQKYDVILRNFKISKNQNILTYTVWPIVPITLLFLQNRQFGRLAAKNSNLLNLHFDPFWSNVTYDRLAHFLGNAFAGMAKRLISPKFMLNIYKFGRAKI